MNILFIGADRRPKEATFNTDTLIVASIDPCYSCTERVTVVDVRKQTAKLVSYKEMERYCRERKDSPLK